MNKNILIAFLLLLSFSSGAQNLSVIYNSKQFNLPEDSLTLVENYLSIAAHSLKYKPNSDGQLQAQIQATQIYKQGDKIIDFKKYTLNGTPIGVDSIAIDVLDQQRFTLKPDKYTFDLELVDLNNENSEVIKLSEAIEVTDYNTKLGFSDVQFIETFGKAEKTNEFTKSGYNITPLVSNHLPLEIIKMAYYSELYQSNKAGESFLMIQFIQDYETSQQLRKYAKMSKVESAEVIPILNVFNIEELPSGKYNLVLQLKDKNNIVIAEKKTFFTRENPTQFDVNNFLSSDISSTFVNQYPDSLMIEYINCLYPIASNLEASIINRSDSVNFEMKKRFFYSFWKDRNENNPEEEWLTYKSNVNKVEKLFSSQILHGYETDRGRIYLKFGAPNSRSERPSEPSSYPYEIWHYHVVQGQRDRRFVFYTKDIATNDFQLIHSDAIGEVNNYRWQTYIYRRTWDAFNVDDVIAPESYGSFATDYYLQPR